MSNFRSNWNTPVTTYSTALKFKGIQSLLESLPNDVQLSKQNGWTYVMSVEKKKVVPMAQSPTISSSTSQLPVNFNSPNSSKYVTPKEKLDNPLELPNEKSTQVK